MAMWRRTTPPKTGSNFKLWGYMFPVVFILGQGLYISRYLKDDAVEKS